MRFLKALAATVAAVVLFTFTAVAPASADHTHVLRHKDGSCTILAKNGGEKYVQLPNREGASNRTHPLHLNVHLGRPGASGKIAVKGPADGCSYYKNG